VPGHATDFLSTALARITLSRHARRKAARSLFTAKATDRIFYYRLNFADFYHQNSCGAVMGEDCHRNGTPGRQVLAAIQERRFQFGRERYGITIEISGDLDFGLYAAV
jgi:hypothetical protein